ncbi:MAG TPA: LCP family protein, partial [Desulfosporosinus sp.]|nr:LCP family protein [Desulfosporosinus sp.]
NEKSLLVILTKYFILTIGIFHGGLFDAKGKKLEMEWTRMQEDKYDGRTIFRVLMSYKKPILLGLFLGISLVLGAVLVSQVVGNEKKAIIYAVEHGVRESSQLREKIQQQTSNQSEQEFNDVQEPLMESLPVIQEKRFTVLLVGVDRRPGEKTFSNTDSLLVASINTINGKIALLSIPRDTRVTIAGLGTQKINAAARVGKGLETTTALIEGLTGQRIDGYVLTNFSGFKTIIDILGGVTIAVEKDMYYVTGDAADGVINLKKGTQRLNGAQALQYARFRNDAFGDISRTARQQAVLKALGKEFMQIKTVPKLPWLIPQISKAVDTNLSVSQLWSLTNVLLHIEKPEISSQTLPGNFLTENNISYWKVDPRKSSVVVKRLFEEGKTSSVFGTP